MDVLNSILDTGYYSEENSSGSKIEIQLKGNWKIYEVLIDGKVFYSNPACWSSYNQAINILEEWRKDEQRIDEK